MDRKYASASGLLQAIEQLLVFIRKGVSSAAVNDLEHVRSCVPSMLTSELHEIGAVVNNGLLLSVSDLPAYIDAVKSLGGAGIDDRLHLLEKLLVLMSRLPEDSVFAKRLENFVIDMLYKDLPHPPCTYLSSPAQRFLTQTKRVSYAFRTADGSNHNPYFPCLGQAGTPYARSVPSFKAVPPSSLPDPGLVFDVLLRREDFKPHPGGLSSLFFAFANIVIHSIFNTNREDRTINDASSYLDLSPLYGSSQQQLDQVRRKDGTGRIWEDVFADNRLLLMPPAVCALLILFNRNHNFVAEKILSINERGSYGHPSSLKDFERDLQDDEIFHRARLVNCGFFMQVILRDYVGAILALVQDGQKWRLNPLEVVRDIGHEFRPPGQGNAVSIEFNHLYRWHSTMSARDTVWLEGVFRNCFGQGVDFRTITVQNFKEAVHGMGARQDVREWTFHGLQRTANGRFCDADLAAILLDATEAPAGAFCARGIPEVMRVVEIIAIEQSRHWGTCSLNEFRKFIGLKPYKSFKEWNPLPEIHTAAETLYGEIDNLELHVGLQAEQTKLPSPGAGLCPGYTMSRAILADAVSLTRGDRFLTLEFTPFNLTSWGYRDCMFNPNDGSYGGMLTKLLFRTLSSHYSVGSVYTHFPFLVPDYLRSRVVHSPSKYNWFRPPAVRKRALINSYESASQVVTQRQSLAYVDRLRYLTKYPSSGCELMNIIWNDDKNIKKWGAYFSETTQILIQQKSFGWTKVGRRNIDIVGKVIQMLPVLWFINEFAHNLSEMHGLNGRIEDDQLYQMFEDVSNYVLFNLDPALEWGLRENAIEAADQLIGIIKIALERESIKSALPSANWTRSLLGWYNSANDRDRFTAQLVATNEDGRSLDSLSRTLFSEIAPTAGVFSQTLSNVINFYLHEDRRAAREDLSRLLSVPDPNAHTQVLAYINEAIRLDPPVSGIHWTAKTDRCLPSSTISSTDAFISIRDAGLDANMFGPNPEDTVYNRPRQYSLIRDIGLNGFLSPEFFEEVAPQILRVIFSLRNVQRAPGSIGQNNWTLETEDGITRKLYIDAKGCLKPFTSSLMLEYEA